MQTKLFHLLQHGRYTRVGGREEWSANVRVICATNSDLAAAVERRTFRQDLHHRLEIIELHLIPLRERTEDIPQICEYLLEKLARQFGKEAPKLTPAAFHLLKQWKWPGNLRELENWITRIIIFGIEEVLGMELRRQPSSISEPDAWQHRLRHLKEGLARRPRRYRGL
jgi:transcriptional regulator with PAS, ATPase and Fis domain